MQKFIKHISKLAILTHTEKIWRELVDPSEADSAPESLEDHEEWDDRRKDDETSSRDLDKSQTS